MTTTLEKVQLAQRMERLGTESAFDVLVKARALEAAGADIVHLEIGEPDFPTAGHIVEAAVRALRDGWTHYGPSAGLPQLREAVAEDAGRRRGISIDPAEVVITPGAKPIMFFVILALVDPEDEVLYPNPGFPIYESMVEFVGARAVPYALPEANEFEVDVQEILSKMTPRTRLIILNSPHNPTGGVLGREKLEILAKALRGHRSDRELYVLSDEIYSRLIFEGEAASLTQFPDMKDRTIILDGFSKTYAMTGWRLGYGVMRADLAEQVARLQTNANSCTASFTQIAGVEALRGDQACVDNMVAEFRRRRSVMVDGLNRIPGFRCRQPHGAFYVFPNITGTRRSSRSLADALLTEAGVACLSGTAFGAWGEGYLRFSYANSVENIQKALDWIGAWAKKNL
ncbi:MAG TPA: pyridoxal phosphate-dependent aminotransferase [Terriglobia bacterium]|nr:pyridoxal phosphate-dependent aminotransferase [Terriglobia bacterium]